MAWAFVGVSSVVEVTATAHALVTTGITGLAAGDLLVACISSRIASTTAITLPTGWTRVSQQLNNNTLATTSAIPSGMMAYAIRGATDPALTFTHPVAPNVAIGRIVAYRNVAQTSPLDAQTSFTTAIATTPVSGTGLTTTQTDDLIVAMAAGGQEAAWSAFNATDPVGASGATSTAAPTTAWLERADSLTTTGADTSLGIFDAVKLTAGATGNLTATASMSAGHVVVAGAFKILIPPTADAWNKDDKSTNITLSGSDKTATATSGSQGVRSTTKRTNKSAGKYYAEFLISTLLGIDYAGINSVSATITGSGSAQTFRFNTANAAIHISSVSVADLGTFVSNDVLCVAWDAGGEKIWFRLNNGLWNADAVADPATGTNGLNTSASDATDRALWYLAGQSGNSCTLRTEAAEFTYTGPSGFTSWMGEALAAPPVTGTGTPAGQAGDADGAGLSSSEGAGALVGDAAAVGGEGTVGSAEATGTGAVAADASVVSGFGVSASVATGTLAAQTAAVAGAGASESSGAGALAAQAATSSGIGTSGTSGTGALQAAVAAIVGAGASVSTGTGSLVAGSAEVVGTGTAAAANSGALVAEAAAVAGFGLAESIGIGALQAGAAAIAGAGLVASVGTGDLVAGSATVAGEGVVIAVGAAIGIGALVAAAATVAGEGEVTGEVAPPVSAAIGGHWRPEPERPPPVEGVGYAILPNLEGEAHGVVLVAGAGAVPAPRIIGVGTGAAGIDGRSAVCLTAIKAAAVGDRGLAGSASGNIVGIKAAAIGQHDDDETAAMLAFLLAA